MIHQIDGISGQPVVAGIIIRNHGLDAGIANILQLLVIRAIGVGFPGMQQL